MASFTKEVNPRLAKCPLVFNGRLANRGLNSVLKEPTVIWGDMTRTIELKHSMHCHKPLMYGPLQNGSHVVAPKTDAIHVISSWWPWKCVNITYIKRSLMCKVSIHLPWKTYFWYSSNFDENTAINWEYNSKFRLKRSIRTYIPRKQFQGIVETTIATYVCCIFYIISISNVSQTHIYTRLLTILMNPHL